MRRDRCRDHDHRMRRVRWAVIATAVVVLLAACGADDPVMDEPDDATEEVGQSDDDAADTAADERDEADETDDADGADGATANGETIPVDIEDNEFVDGDVEIAVGDTVVWEHTGSSRHTVDFDDEESDDLEPGDTFERTFDEPGEFDYVCFFHPSMTGTVTVTD